MPDLCLCGCGTPLPPNRRKYATTECAKRDYVHPKIPNEWKHRHPCNVCGKEWLAPSRYYRTCPKCKKDLDSVREGYTDDAVIWGF